MALWSTTYLFTAHRQPPTVNREPLTAHPRILSKITDQAANFASNGIAA